MPIEPVPCRQVSHSWSKVSWSAADTAAAARPAVCVGRKIYRRAWSLPWIYYAAGSRRLVAETFDGIKPQLIVVAVQTRPRAKVDTIDRHPHVVANKCGVKPFLARLTPALVLSDTRSSVAVRDRLLARTARGRHAWPPPECDLGRRSTRHVAWYKGNFGQRSETHACYAQLLIHSHWGVKRAS